MLLVGHCIRKRPKILHKRNHEIAIKLQKLPYKNASYLIKF